MSYPADLKYTQTHEWLRTDGAVVTVGVTWFAQDSMGDVVHVELPEVGDAVSAGEPACEIESVKAVSDVYSPATGTIVEVNQALEDAPEDVNSAPYGDGWLFRVAVGSTVVLADLLDADAYETHCAG
ncbi:MAG: glycine cleavage system protein GcvH [Myxococcota bacterium]|nr:glycine cleavage system protein GcvH [Myxococcota bacterium]MEC9390226.1 glycine cleavage system protein GcvH [Myxococcota bacterium]